jgi:hypothetical protein
MAEEKPRMSAEEIAFLRMFAGVGKSSEQRQLERQLEVALRGVVADAYRTNPSTTMNLGQGSPPDTAGGPARPRGTGWRDPKPMIDAQEQRTRDLVDRMVINNLGPVNRPRPKPVPEPEGDGGPKAA